MLTHYQNGGAAEVVGQALLEASMMHCDPRRQTPVICLLGCTTATGDALGPLVSGMLSLSGYTGEVCGGMHDPIHARNLSRRLARVHIELPKRTGMQPFLIIVDAAAGDDLGIIKISEGPTIPGQSQGITLPPVGQMHILGSTHLPGSDIHEAPLIFAWEMARVISGGIILFHQWWARYLSRKVPSTYVV